MDLGTVQRSLIHPDDALAIIRGLLRQPETETVALGSALGRIMPAVAYSGMDQPPFDKAAVDGWGWKPIALEAMPASPLRVRGIIAAGSGSDVPLEPGETVRIMTGAPVPAGVTRVQSFELATEEDGFVTFTKAERIGNVIRRGENAATGDELLTSRVLCAQDIAILASDGRATVNVARRPVVGVLSTGAELVEPGEPLSGAKIYDSNRPQILAQLASPAFDLRDLGHLPDEFEATKAAVGSALAECDVLLLSGGVSMGDFDYVPRALLASGVETRFHGVAMKPGKPTYFGTTDRAFVIGLPGNPVSVFVNVELLVKELLFALCGAPYRPLVAPVPVPDGITRKSTSRVEFLPVAVGADGARTVRYGGSSGLQALAGSHGFVRLEIGQSTIEKGTVTNVRFVR
ncbi:MAG: molybdopterin molybdotransferase MoeA [Spirochaetales bacterium]|nr:molybdopterin molybdotransferase MoeA [Spirochaetales bacterium]